MIVLLIPAAACSLHVKREVEPALGAKSNRRRLIPVVVKDPDRVPSDKIPWIARRVQGLGLEESEADAPEIAEARGVPKRKRDATDWMHRRTERRTRCGPDIVERRVHDVVPIRQPLD